MPHGEGWQFIRLGRYLERAYSHATLLDVYSSEFWNQPNRLTEGSDYLEGIGLLRSCTAFEAYCKVYTADISPERILEFLLLNSEFPHTIRYSIESVQDALDGLEAEARSRRVTSLHRISGRLRAALSYADISETILNGIGPYLRDIVRQCRDVHSKIYQLYINYSIESALAE